MDAKTASEVEVGSPSPQVARSGEHKRVKTLYPDCPWSWMVAVGCSCMNFFTVVMIRSAGVVYVNIVDYFGVTRQEAAWPISIVPGCANLAGPFVAVIVRKVGVRPVAIIGTFMMSLSIMLCFFAPNILYLSVFLGVFHGIGSGMTITPNAVCLNEWFDRMKVRASGIIYTGACLGSFVFPVLFKYCNDVFGIRGCFLIFGALMMNAVAFSFFIRSPPWRVKARKAKLKAKRVEKQKQILSNGGPQENKGFVPDLKLLAGPSTDAMFPVIPQSNGTSKDISIQNGIREETPNSTRETMISGRADGTELVASQYQLPKRNFQRSISQQPPEPRATDGSNKPRSDSVASGESTAVWPRQHRTSEGSQAPEDHSHHRGSLRRQSSTRSSLSNFYCIYEPTAHSNAINTIPELDDIEEDHVSIATYQHVEVTKKKLVNRVSLLMGLTYVFVTYSNMAFMTVLMDFAQDRHVPLDKAVYLLSGFATSDIVGRLSVGWVSDKGILENKTILGLSCSAFGLCMQVLPFFSTYEGIMFMSILVGYAIGNTVVLFNVVLGDAVGVERIPTAIGCISFVAGLTAFSRPFLIGHFRDNIGSYDNMIRSLGAVVLVLGILWFSLRIYEKTRSKGFDVEVPSDATPGVPQNTGVQ
ncbi:uncharacterized protein LOC8031149 [Ixodes scapularis]|nr:uncharacterized protein LOC8031149 [Ixodes scapularis]